MKYQLEIVANAGYDPEQVEGITVGNLKHLLDEFNDEDEIILHDENNRYGASYGKLLSDYQECNVDEDWGDE